MFKLRFRSHAVRRFFFDLFSVRERRARTRRAVIEREDYSDGRARNDHDYAARVRDAPHAPRDLSRSEPVTRLHVAKATQDRERCLSRVRDTRSCVRGSDGERAARSPQKPHDSGLLNADHAPAPPLRVRNSPSD